MTLLVWAAVAAAALYWGLRLFARPIAVPPQAQLAEAAGVPRGDLTRLFGADAPVAQAAAPEPATDARFTLLGVVNPRAPQAAREGLALISVEGKPPRAYRVGAVVDGPHVLKSVSARGATLGPREGAPVISLDLPPLPAAATGSFPPPAPLPGGASPRLSPQTSMPQPAPMALPPGGPPGAPLPLPPSQGDPGATGAPMPQPYQPPVQREPTLR
jgi:general secretion pathway protein C